jgi:hypothetical protein
VLKSNKLLFISSKIKHMKISLNCLLATLFVLFTTGCIEDNWVGNTTVNGAGPIVTTPLDLSSFNKINLTGVANFYIGIGSPQAVVLKAQQNIIDVMKWEVSDQTLKVGFKNNVSVGEHEEIRFEITVPSMNNIVLTGVGDFILSGSDQSALSIKLTGVGNVRAFDMKAGECSINLSGVGNCEVYAIDRLNVTITGVGSVYYKGNPTVNSTITGLGYLINSN